MSNNIFSVRNFLLFSVLAMIILEIGALQIGAQSAGTSTLVMSQNSTTIYLNSSLAIPFTVNYTSGTAGVTDLIIANGQALSNNGVDVGLNQSSGTPTFNDILFINTNLQSSVVPGVYIIQIESGGADPISQRFFNFTLTVANSTAPLTSISTTSIIVNATAQSAATKSEEQNIGIVFGIALVVIIVLLIVNKIRSV
jgi:hypothetical protein